jgi:DNA-binding Xre family transcriptional regulator
MAISWKLKTYLSTTHSVYTLVDLQKTIALKTEFIISSQNLGNIVNHRPKQIRLETIEIICSALDCKLDDFLEIKPKKINNINDKQKLSYQRYSQRQTRNIYSFK